MIMLSVCVCLPFMNHQVHGSGYEDYPIRGHLSAMFFKFPSIDSEKMADAGTCEVETTSGPFILGILKLCLEKYVTYVTKYFRRM